MTKPKRKSDAKQRIIETAEKLFYANGIRAVGIDRIIADAGVAKMTLYNHFKSKDDLILAVLVYREAEFSGFMDRSIKAHMVTGQNRLEAFFSTLGDWFESPGFRGCSFINAAVELADSNHPASVFSQQHKVQFGILIEEILVETCGPKAKKLAGPMNLLVEGAIVTAVVQGQPGAALVASTAVQSMVAQLK